MKVQVKVAIVEQNDKKWVSMKIMIFIGLTLVEIRIYFNSLVILTMVIIGLVKILIQIYSQSLNPF